MSDTEVVGPVEAVHTPAHPVGRRRALPLHHLVFSADVAAVQTPGQVVPELGEVLLLARLTSGGRGCRAVRGHVRAGRTLVAGERCPCDRVLALVGGDGALRRGTAEDSGEQDEQR